LITARRQLLAVVRKVAARLPSLVVKRFVAMDFGTFGQIVKHGFAIARRMARTTVLQHSSRLAAKSHVAEPQSQQQPQAHA